MSSVGAMGAMSGRMLAGALVIGGSGGIGIVGVVSVQYHINVSRIASKSVGIAANSPFDLIDDAPERRNVQERAA
jgi:hypothetical protein